MLRSLDLRKEPSVRQSDTILRRIDEELTTRGARVDRAGAVGGLRFRMPRPWHAPRLGILLAITSGRALVSAGSGGPWRVRYELNFSTLRWLTLGLTAILVILVIGGYAPWDRSMLLSATIVLWIVLYGVPYAAASMRFEQIIRASAAEIVERRHKSRPTSGVSDVPPGGEALDSSTPPKPSPPKEDPPSADSRVYPTE